MPDRSRRTLSQIIRLQVDGFWLLTRVVLECEYENARMSSLPPLVICPVCHLPIDLEKSKTDENGNAVHGECYVQRLKKALRPN